MSDVLILGGTGHLGSALRARLPGGVAFTHHSTARDGSIPFDFRETASLPSARVVIGAFPLARLMEGWPRERIADAVRRYVGRCGDARIVQLSTDAVYSGDSGPRSERDPPDPRTAYGRAQAEVDNALATSCSDVLIVRTSFIFGWAGERLDKRLAPLVREPSRIASQAWASNLYRSPTEVNFLAEGIVRAVERGTTGIVNIAGPRMSIAAFFERALEPFGLSELPPPYVEASPDVARDTSLTSARMEEELNLWGVQAWEWYQSCLPDRRVVSPTVGLSSARSRTLPPSSAGETRN